MLWIKWTLYKFYGHGLDYQDMIKIYGHFTVCMDNLRIVWTLYGYYAAKLKGNSYTGPPRVVKTIWSLVRQTYKYLES